MKYLGIINILALVILMHSPGQAYADTKPSVYAESGSYDKTLNAWSSASKSIFGKHDSWIWNYSKKDNLHKNGTRDSLLIIPSSAIPEDITLIVWFHGLNGFSERTFSKRVIPQINNLVKKNSSFAFAIPEMPWSINTKTPRGRQGRVWLEQGGLENYIKAVKARLKSWSAMKHNKALGVVRIVFVGHSAGGSAIMSASKEGGLCRAEPEHVIWSDATYGSWLSKAWSGCIKDMDRNTEAHIIVRKWDSPHTQANKVIKGISRYGPKVIYQVMDRGSWSHKKIGDNILGIVKIFPSGC